MSRSITIRTDISQLESAVNTLESLFCKLDPDDIDVFSSAFDDLVLAKKLSTVEQFDQLKVPGMEILLTFTPSPELNALTASIRNTVQIKELHQHAEKTKFSTDQVKSALGIYSDISADTKSRDTGDVHSDLSLKTGRNNSRLNKLVDLMRAVGNKIFIKFIGVIFRLRNFRKKLADHN